MGPASREAAVTTPARRPWFPLMSPQQTEVVRWVLRLLALTVIVVVVSTGHRHIDRPGVAASSYAIAGGHLDQAYVPDPGTTGQVAGGAFQPPGFPVAAAIVIAVWDGIVGPGGAAAALTFAALCTAAVVVIAGARLVGGRQQSLRNEALFLAAMAVTPFFKESLGDYFHPEDVLALGLVLVSLSLASDGRWLWAGAGLGLAVGSKQWALLVLPVLLLMAPERQAKSRLATGTVAAAAFLYVPFMLISPQSAWQVLRGPIPVPGGLVPQTTLEGMLREAPLHVAIGQVNDLARFLPLLFAALLVVVWAQRASRSRLVSGQGPDLDQVVGLLLICFAFRLVGDCIALSYYALPLSVLIAIAEARRGRTPLLAIASSFTLAFWYGTHVPKHLLGPWAGAAVFTFLIAAIAGGALLIVRTPTVGKIAESSRLEAAG